VKMARAVIALLGGRTPMQVIVGGISKPGVEGADTQQSDLVGLGELSRPLSWRCDWGSTSSTGALVHRLDESGRVQQLSAHQILEFSGDGGECGRTSSVSMCGHWNHDEEEKKKKTCAETETQRAQEKGKSLSDLRVWNC